MGIMEPNHILHPNAAVEGAPGMLRIDLAALRRNYARLAALPSHGRVGAVLKANAYGLGAEAVAKALLSEGCRQFFVAQFSEAVSLRQFLPPAVQIFVLNGLLPGCERSCAIHGIIPVLNSLEQFRNWLATAKLLGHRLPAVLQFDTGMSRLGIPPQEREIVLALLGEATELDTLFIMSHLACADEHDGAQNSDQLAEMAALGKLFAGFDICLANSGGIFLGRDYHGVLVRSGIAIYGGVPTSGLDNPMERVVSLDVAVIQTRTVPAGTRVGYGASHVTRRETHLATIAAGYADGLPRSLGDRGAVFHQGVRLPIVGRVSMDSMTIDITALPEGTLQLGSYVEILGPHQTLEDVATAAGTISYEILTSLGQRYCRQYV